MPDIIVENVDERKDDKRPSVLKNYTVGKKLSRSKTIKPEYKLRDFWSGFVAIMTNIASLAAAIFLIVMR